MCSKCGQELSRRPSGRSRCLPCENSYQKAYYHANVEMARPRKAKQMREARLDPIKRARMNASQRASWNRGGRERNRVYQQRRKISDFFGYHLQFARRFIKTITVADLSALWTRQDGLCGLTGVIMEQKAGAVQLDHILPVARGGAHDLANLRWVTKTANLAKRDLTDAEFATLCSQVAEWIGRRIVAATGRTSEEGEAG